MKAAMAEYRKKLAAYNKAWDAYEKIAGPYWRAVTDKRSRRRTKVANNMRLTADDYVMTQPPVYNGPPKARQPAAPGKKQAARSPTSTDFLANAKAEFDFVPEAPADEVTYKRAYAEVAAANGLTKEAAREDLRLRIRRRRQVRHPGRARVRHEGARHLHGAGLQPAADHQHRRPAGRGRRRVPRRAAAPRPKAPSGDAQGGARPTRSPS